MIKTPLDGYKELARRLLKDSVKEGDVPFLESVIGSVCQELSGVYVMSQDYAHALEARKATFMRHKQEYIADKYGMNKRDVMLEARSRGWIPKRTRKKGAWRKYL